MSYKYKAKAQSLNRFNQVQSPNWKPSNLKHKNIWHPTVVNMQVESQTRISLLQLHRLFFYFSVLVFIQAPVLSLPKVFPVYSDILFTKQSYEGELLLKVFVNWMTCQFCFTRDMLHILVELQISCTVSLLFVIFMSNWNLRECFKTSFSLDYFPCTYAKSLLWSSTNLNLRVINLVTDNLVEQLMRSRLTWQGGLEAVKEMVFHRSHKKMFKQGLNRDVEGHWAGELFRLQDGRRRWEGKGRAVNSLRNSMSTQIAIEEWERGRKWLQMSTLATYVWLFVCIRSVWYLVFLEVSASAPYVCKYKALPPIWGTGMDGRRGCHFCQEVTVKDQKSREVQETGRRQHAGLFQ